MSWMHSKAPLCCAGRARRVQGVKARLPLLARQRPAWIQLAREQGASHYEAGPAHHHRPRHQQNRSRSAAPKPRPWPLGSNCFYPASPGIFELLDIGNASG